MDDHQHPKMKVDEAGNLWLNFGQYGQEVELACFSKDGSRLLTVQEVGVAKIFDTESSELIGEIRPVSKLTGSDKAPTTSEFEVYIEAVALTNDGKLALLGLNDGTAGVFEVSTGNRLSTLLQKEAPPEHWELIRAVNFSSDDTMALVGFYDRTVGIWNTTGEKLIARFCPDNAEMYYSKDGWGRENLVTSVAASADNRYIFVGCMDFTCSIWDLQNREPIFTATEYREEVICVSAAEHGFLWATAGGSVWKKDRNDEPKKLLASKESWVEAKFAPSGEFLLARTRAGEIQKRNLFNGEVEVLATLRAAELFETCTTFGFMNGDNYFYSPSNDCIKLDDITIKVIEVQEPQDTIKSVLLSPDKSILAIKTDLKTIELWDRATGKLIRQLPSDIRHYAFSNDSSKIAFCTTDTERGFIKIEDVRTGELVQRFIVHGINDVVFAFGLTDKTIITGSARNQTVRLWQRDDSKSTNSSGSTSVSRSESNSGKYLEVKKLTFDYCQDLIFAFQPNGNIVIGHKGGEVEVWSPDLRTKLCYAPLKMGYDTLWCIAENGAELVYAERGQVFVRIDLTTGTISKFQPTLDRPEFVPNSKQDQDIVARAGALVWRQFGGPYVHITDGPRGWATPIHMSKDQKLAVIPCYTEVVVLSLEEEEEEEENRGEEELIQKPHVRARLPFEGRLRAAYVDNKKVMAVDSKGKLFAKNYGKEKKKKR